LQRFKNTSEVTNSRNYSHFSVWIHLEQTVLFLYFSATQFSYLPLTCFVLNHAHLWKRWWEDKTPR